MTDESNGFDPERETTVLDPKVDAASLSRRPVSRNRTVSGKFSFNQIKCKNSKFNLIFLSSICILNTWIHLSIVQENIINKSIINILLQKT